VALQTKSAPEWRRWMICYARDLASSGDEGRLRELLGELLGPLRSGSGSGAAGQEGGWQPQVRPLPYPLPARGDLCQACGARSRAAARRAPSAPPAAPAPAQVLGLDKRAFLRTEVLREVGRTRQHQRLVNEYVELLAEVAREQPAAMQQ
jgi:hypothetical protein